MCQILDSCKKAGVSYLEIGAIRVTLGAAPVQNLSWLQSAPRKATILEGELESAKHEALDSDSRALRQEQLDELAITNPALYEKLVLNGDLIDEVTEPHADIN